MIPRIPSRGVVSVFVFGYNRKNFTANTIYAIFSYAFFRCFSRCLCRFHVIPIVFLMLLLSFVFVIQVCAVLFNSVIRSSLTLLFCFIQWAIHFF